MKAKKIWLSVLLITLIATCMCIFTVMAAEKNETTEPKLSIYAQNLSFDDNIFIKYAITAKNADLEKVQLLIWTEPQTEYVYGTQGAVLQSSYEQEINGSNCAIFAFRNFSAKQMTDVVYARAYYSDGENEYYSTIKKYSILQYIYNKLGKTGTETKDEKLKLLLNNMLIYGASAQIYFDYRTDSLATMDFYQIKLVGGVLNDGCDNGLYGLGTEVSITAPEINEKGESFSHWLDSNGQIIANTANHTISIENKNAVYTAVYVKYSSGLEYDSNGDGTCCLIGMGDCTDAELKIPPKSPDGDLVTEIDSSAFAGEALVSVSFPYTLADIGRKAFNGCTSITDVYYGGTAEEWAEVNIGSGNETIENATMHFAGVTNYTVTFVDYDGTVIKTETVNSGDSASAPANPTRGGYVFNGWSQSFDNVQGDMEVTALYIIAHNQLYFTYADNGDGTTTMTASIMGDVKIYGLEMNLSFELSGAKYASVESVAQGLLANKLDDSVIISFVNPSGKNLTENTELVRVIFTNTGDSITINTMVSNIDIFDEDYVNETYTVLGNEYTK